jgi:hypothetical protein
MLMSDLRGINTPPQVRGTGSAEKITAAIVVAAALALVAVLSIQSDIWRSPPPNQIVADRDLPSPSRPVTFPL